MQGPLGWREKEGKGGGEGSGLWDLCPWGLRTGSGRRQCSGEREEGLALEVPVQGGREARSRGEEGDCASRRQEAGWTGWSQTRCFSTGGATPTVSPSLSQYPGPGPPLPLDLSFPRCTWPGRFLKVLPDLGTVCASSRWMVAWTSRSSLGVSQSSWPAPPKWTSWGLNPSPCGRSPQA